MTDWDAGARAAIARLQARVPPYSEERALVLIDGLAASGSMSRKEMLAHGSRYFIMTALGHVTIAVHGGGRVPKHGGWYRIRPGQPYMIDPGFCAAWIRVRQATRRD